MAVPKTVPEAARGLGLAFTKMNGCGNDFIMIDGRHGLPAESLGRLAALLCGRQRGLGADGIVALYPAAAAGADFAMRYVNASGAPGEMCGNGARCAARFALEIGLAGANAAFETDAGLVRSEVDGADVSIDIPPPAEVALGLDLDLGGRRAVVHRLKVGVPHAVTFVRGLESYPVDVEGPLLRAHSAFAAGCNANFVELRGGEIAMRTYERGVEAETLACGTGAVACAAVCFLLGHTEKAVSIRTRGGDLLRVTLVHGSAGFGRAHLAGPTEIVAQGSIDAGFLRRHAIL
jgi:diaminopimelate epimerase